MSHSRNDAAAMLAPFSVDPIDASVFLAAYKRKHDMPEKLLMAAVLADALDTLAKYGRVDSHYAQALCAEAWAWINGAPAPYSFDDVTTYLGIDGDWLRDSLRRREVRQAGRRAVGVAGSRTEVGARGDAT